MSTCPHTCLQPNFGSLLKIVDGCHFGQPHHKIGKKKTEKPLVRTRLFGARGCQRFLTSKISPVEKTACNLHKRRDFLGKNIPKFATFQGKKTGFKSPFLDYRFLQLARIGEVLLLKDQWVPVTFGHLGSCFRKLLTFLFLFLCIFYFYYCFIYIFIWMQV